MKNWDLVILPWCTVLVITLTSVRHLKVTELTVQSYIEENYSIIGHTLIYMYLL